MKQWSGHYCPRVVERKLLGEVRFNVAGRGYYRRNEFLQAGAWKSPRSKTYLERNSAEDIEEITRIALAAPERLAFRILDVLEGVGVPMASALLTVSYPLRFTVIDFRSIETLWEHAEIDSKRIGYWEYLGVCRRIARRVHTDLRTLDQALWQWSKERGSQITLEADSDDDAK
ncbi:hypothetical protein A5697_16250 [Mycobacterium sp. E3251]|nr:hypothetical protein A5697_16250 [Mycobacterium sp. E3251]